MSKIVESVKQIVRKEAEKGDPGDWLSHMVPVHDYAVALAEKTGADEEVVEVAAWLHDIGRLKFGDANHDETGAEEAERILKKLGCDREFIDKVKHCVLAHSYPLRRRSESLEARIVASADAMAHFYNVDWLLEVGLKITGSPKSAVKWVFYKLERDWKEKMLVPEAREMARKKYEESKSLLESTLTD